MDLARSKVAVRAKLIRYSISLRRRYIRHSIAMMLLKGRPMALYMQAITPTFEILIGDLCQYTERIRWIL